MHTRIAAGQRRRCAGSSNNNKKCSQGRLHDHFDILNWCAHVLFQYRQAEQAPAPHTTAETMEIEDWGFMQIDSAPETMQGHPALQNGLLELADAPAERDESATDRKRKRLSHEAEDSERSVLVVDSQGCVQAPPTHHAAHSTPVSLALQIGNIDEAQAQLIRQLREDALERFAHAIEAPATAGQLEAPPAEPEQDPSSTIHLTHFEQVQTATGSAEASAPAARSKYGRLTKEHEDLLEIIKPRLVYLLHYTHHQLNQQNGEGSVTQLAYAEQLRSLAIETFPGEEYSRLFAAQPRTFYKKVINYATELEATRKE